MSVPVQRMRKLEAHVASVEKQHDAQIDFIEGKLNELHQGQVRLEATLNAAWNTFNVFIFMFKEVLVELGYVKNEKEYQAKFVELGKQLYQEAVVHGEAEKQRITEAQARGETPTPMQPAPTDAMQRTVDTMKALMKKEEDDAAGSNEVDAKNN